MEFNSLGRFLRDIFLRGLESINKYYSDYRGFVVDNNDPENMGRLKLRIPQVWGMKPAPIWVSPKNQFAGKDYGIQIIPQVGDMVMVSFEYGNHKFPLWSHGYFGKDEKPSEFSSTKVFGFKTPEGNIITIDDEKTEVTVKTKDGGIIQIKGGNIELNGAANDGVVKINPLVNKLNRLEQKYDELITLYNTHTHTIVGLTSGGDTVSGNAVVTSNLGSPIATHTQKLELENGKVKHG